MNIQLSRSQMKAIMGGSDIDLSKYYLCGTEQPGPYSCLCDYCNIADGTPAVCEIPCPLDNCGIAPPGGGN